MSAIAGLLRFDGGSVTRHGLERAANALRQYGPDRADIAIADGIGLVHVLMRMTPEDQFDRQPWQGASGALITADVRLDNRDEVAERIGIMPGEARAWPDSRVLLAGWEKLGDVLWPMLRGRDLGCSTPRFDAGARSSRAQRGDVAQERAIFRLRHHAERTVRAR
jgi:asparagine synthetase B (glutamine-hydrolysing)